MRRLAVAVTAMLLSGAQEVPRADILIRGGTVATGDAAPFTGDVAIRGDRILAIGPRLDLPAARVIEAKGMLVAPGFIDPHTHAEGDLLATDAAARLVPQFLMQGVTTVMIGNDGGGAVDVGATLASAATRPVGVNYGAHVGFGAVRRAVLRDADRAPSPAELARMRSLVADAMCAGARGLSTGLFYAPQSFATIGEVVSVAAEAGRRGGIYDSHIRDESSYSIGLQAAIAEAIEIGRRASTPVNIAHIKALGVDVEGQAGAVIAQVEAAQAASQRVTADQYPWDASGTSLVAALVPRWAQDGGRGAMLARFDDAAAMARMRPEMIENLRRRGGAAKLLVTAGPEGTTGRTLAQIAAAMRSHPVDAAIAVIRRDDPAVASFNQSEADIAAFMVRPWVMTGSDASTGHPRTFGSFARKWRLYVRERRLIDTASFVRASAALAADTLRIEGRGRLVPGHYADIVVLDPRRYRERADYAQPRRLSEGVEWVLVNGRIAVARAKLTGVAAGRALPAKPTGGCA
ncbi:N-acyl-D-amino-acid deacylase family protein [Sphingomonas baiyangensis]|uniref:D-aminoacylase n=1 Tax=Sphingomonas baiyangensis TaxID=2572576 RepID=A0A4U1L346_9SPHN|nr:amidohydrolase family protein [Sphingomonas baiyangensis]TKD51072.1 D-aminoacylase [Sphingomonas baiyangensis]